MRKRLKKSTSRPDPEIKMTRMLTMNGQKNGKGRMFPTLVAVLICLAAFGVRASAPAPAETGQPRVDIIQIDGLKAFGALERPPVVYLHQKHTEALAPKNKDCGTCHLSAEGRMSIKYMRLEDSAKQTVMNVYHDNCIACHREMKSASEKSGPLVCAECHAEKQVASAWVPFGMDKSLHYRHVKAQEKKCEACHHEYDEAAQKLVYVKGNEGSCRYCHGEEKVENRIALRAAAHLDCVNCHQDRLARSMDGGPVTCAGCHALEQQKLIEVVEDVPRLERNQPDVALIRPHAKEEPAPALNRLNAVPFDHKAHEAANDSCRVCHHADLNACVTCHTASGSEKGNYVSLQDSMHRANAEMSCMGCHNARQQADPACTGCHGAIPPEASTGQQNCLVCHMELPEGIAEQTDEKQTARMLLKSRQPLRRTYPTADIPEVVEINNLSDQYDIVRMPHRRIVTKLMAGTADDDLAAYFHREPGTICQGCHHNSPVSPKPPKCASCHGKPFDAKDLMKPGLMGAYHIQCMDCHAAMGLERPVATNCTGCHRAKP